MSRRRCPALRPGAPEADGDVVGAGGANLTGSCPAWRARIGATSSGRVELHHFDDCPCHLDVARGRGAVGPAVNHRPRPRSHPQPNPPTPAPDQRTAQRSQGSPMMSALVNDDDGSIDAMFAQPFTTADEVATRIAELGGWVHRDRAGRWTVQCPHPGHVDVNPSASLKAGRDGVVLLHCFACQPGDRNTWFGEAMRRLVDGSRSPPHPHAPAADRTAGGTASSSPPTTIRRTPGCRW